MDYDYFHFFGVSEISVFLPTIYKCYLKVIFGAIFFRELQQMRLFCDTDTVGWVLLCA